MATYPPPPYSGGYYHPSPYPSTAPYPPTASGFSTAPVYPFPSAFPCAATYPYPPSAVAYTPASGFSPNWRPPPPAPFPIPTPIDPNRPPPTPPPPINGVSHLSPVLHPLHNNYSPPTTDHLQVQGTPQPIAVPTAPAREDRPPQRSTAPVDSARFSQSSPAGMRTPSHTPSEPTRHSFLEDDAAVLAATDERAQVKDVIRHRQHREFLNLQARLDKQIASARSRRYSIDKLHGEISKLSTLVSQFAVAMGMETTEAPVTGSSPASAQFSSPATTALMLFGTSATASSPASSLSSPSDASATAVVVPQMPDEMPQCYGLDNLNRQSLFLADGTERSYYALPENYPLERATPEPVFAVYDDKADGCSNEFVHVFASTPEQQPYEDEQQTSDQLLKCVRNATELTQATACLNTTSDVQVFSLELQQQDDERAYSCSDLKASVPVVTRSSQLSIEHSSMREFRLLWDPGALASHSNKGSTVIIHQQLHNKNRSSMQEFSFEKGRQSQWDPGKQTILSSVQNRDIGSVYFTTHVLLVPSASCSESTENCLANQELTANASSKVPALTWHSSLLGTPSILSSTTYTWDPGDTELQVLFSNVASAKKLQCTDVYKSKMVQLLVGKLGASRAPIFQSAIMCPYALGLGWTEVIASANIQQLRAPALNILLLHERRKEWDPGDDCFGQPVDLKQFWVQLLLPSHSWYNTTNAFLQVHYCCWPFVLNCPYSEPVQLLVCSSCMFSSTEAIMSAMCMSTANTIHMILLLSSGERTQEGRDTTAVYHVFKTQLPMSRTSHIWDPGVQLSLYCWLNIVTEWSEMIKPLSCTNIPELATWHSQVISASYVWDPGTMLLWYRSIWSLRFTEEKEMGRLIPERGSLWFNAMHYCQIFQNCHAMSSQLYGNQDIKFTGIDLWMIHFLPP